MTDSLNYAQQLATSANLSSLEMVTVTPEMKNEWLIKTAELIKQNETFLLSANAEDIKRAPEYNLTPAQVDRLTLDPKRLASICNALEEISKQPDPIGEIIEKRTQPNGLQIQRVRVPLGVVFFIFESRPNVTIDAAAICLKSGNSVILRGGKEALNSNMAFYELMERALKEVGIPSGAIQLVNSTDRDIVGHLLTMKDEIDITIPRGGKSLIKRVSENATMPVMKHYDGVCHVYVEKTADIEQATKIAINSKCQRPGVCNAAESLLIDADIASTALPQIARALQNQGVTLYGCEKSQEFAEGILPATEENYRTEYLELKMSVKVVLNVKDSIHHINTYGSHHTDAIVSINPEAIKLFEQLVDSSAVVINASTRFNDGGELGLGAEIGISTDKYHARGPCGVRELTTYKYIVAGNGQIRE